MKLDYDDDEKDDADEGHTALHTLPELKLSLLLLLLGRRKK